MRLLVIEDDRTLQVLLHKGLSAESHVVDVIATGAEGLERAQSQIYDALILDLTLPDMDGLEVARRLRATGSTLPVVMLTARAAVTERLQGFAAGADDYLSKPFSFQELVARLVAVTRRGGSSLAHDRLIVGELVLDHTAHEVTRGGQPITLAPREYALLEFMMRHPGQALTRMVLFENVWEYNLDTYTNVVDASIRRLRQAVDQNRTPSVIETVRGVGYKIKP